MTYTGVIEMVKSKKKEVNQASSKLSNLIIARNQGGYRIYNMPLKIFSMLLSLLTAK